MKVLLLVQSEGRGHLSQAMVVASILRENGVEIAAVVTGKNPNRSLPAYFRKRMPVEIHQLDSFSFVYSASQKGINTFKTILHTLNNFSQHLSSVKQLSKIIKEKKPDLILNFYEPLGALHFLFNPFYPVKRIGIGHQYLQLHPEYEFPKGNWSAKFLFKLYTRFTALGNNLNLALSATPVPRANALTIIPPLLRPEISLYRQETTEKIILAYVVNPGYRSEIEILALQYPEYNFHLFSDTPKEDYGNICYHIPDDQLFLRFLSRCDFFLSTAGFESVCEALFLNKKIFLVPVAQHFEQLSNAYEFSASPSIFYGKSFLEFNTNLPYKPVNPEQQFWIEQGRKACWNVLSPYLSRNIFSYPNSRSSSSSISSSFGS